MCFWEDDPVQLRWPDYETGANKTSLIEAQRNDAARGACERRLLGHLRGATAEEPQDPGWRPIDQDRDSFENLDVKEGPWPPPDERTVLYWWRPTFWRRGRLEA